MVDRQQQLIEGAVTRALDDLFQDLPARPLTRHRVEHVMRGLAQRVASDASGETLLSLLTTQDMAERLGVSVQRVRALAKARGVGWQVSRGTWVFLPEDVERLRPGPVGRPPAK